MAKIVLALDTSFSACSVALQCGDEIKFCHQMAPMQQTKLLLPMIQAILESNSVKLNQLDAIAFGCGPASFTGVRIASSVAQGLSFAASCPVIPISSLAATAQAAYQEKQWSNALVAIDARAGNVYWAAYELSSGCMTLVGKETIISPFEIIENNGIFPADRTPTGWYAIGDGWGRYKEALTTHLGFEPVEIDANQLPTASAVLNLANIALNRGLEKKHSFEAIPVYLR